MADVSIGIKGDSSSAVRAMDKVSSAADEMKRSTDKAADAASKASRDLSGIADKSDAAASASAQLAGGMGDLGGALAGMPGPLGALGKAMEASQIAIMGVTGASDLLNFATDKMPGVFGKADKSTKTMTKTQKALNLVMRANPFLLVATLVLALGTALVVAYKKSETFKRIVDAAFKAVGTAIKWVWRNVISPVFAGFLTILAAVIRAFAKLLQAIGHVPGFGWVGDLGDKLETAAGKVDEVRDNIRDLDGESATADIRIPGLSGYIRGTDQLLANLYAIPGAVAGAGIGAGIRTSRTPVPTSGRLAGGGLTVNVNVPPTANPVQTGRELARVLAAFKRAGGVVVA